jgi:Cys-tRNA(Pro)/Cys-tRNA(Cys) deacylase
MGRRRGTGGDGDTLAVRTNAIRRLEARGVAFETRRFAPSIHHAGEAARAMGLPPAAVYKTLVIQRERGRPLLVMVPGPCQIDLRRLAAALGEKRLSLARRQDAERLTGLPVGGIGALALLDRPFDVYLDRAALSLRQIWVNPGRRGINVGLPVEDLIQVTGARLVDATGEAGAAPAGADGMSSEHAPGGVAAVPSG